MLEDSDIIFGFVKQTGGSEKFTFTADAPNPNGVRIVMKLQRNHLFRVLGRDTFRVSNSAMAGQIDRDVALVLDRSGSMVYTNDDGTASGWIAGTPAPPNSRWVKVEQAADAFLDTLATETPMAEKVSLVTYNGSATIDDDLTFDYSQRLIQRSRTSQTITRVVRQTLPTASFRGKISLLDPSFGRAWAAKTIVDNDRRDTQHRFDNAGAGGTDCGQPRNRRACHYLRRRS